MAAPCRTDGAVLMGPVLMGPVLGRPVQVAYAVRDLQSSALRWMETHGAGPFFVLEHIQLCDVRYRGIPSTFDHSSAYGQWGEVMVELVCDHTVGPSPITDVVGANGEGLHHLAHFVDDLAVAQAHCAANGWPEALYATTSTGMAFAFHDARTPLGHMVELYEPTDHLRAFYQRVYDSSIGWNGENPVRSAR
jgi:Glyoxalase/Bleomycin resistance protein/Dioxygenase superfamily